VACHALRDCQASLTDLTPGDRDAWTPEFVSVPELAEVRQHQMKHYYSDFIAISY
jgi:hypothetical protein